MALTQFYVGLGIGMLAVYLTYQYKDKLRDKVLKQIEKTLNNKK